MSISGGVSSIFSGAGELAASGAYFEAAGLEDKNAHWAQLSGDVQQNAETRQLYQVAGTTQSVQAAGGGALSGSSLDVMKANAQQGSLQKSLTSLQTNIDVTGFKAQAAAYRGEGEAAAAQGAGDIAGGVLSIFGL